MPPEKLHTASRWGRLSNKQVCFGLTNSKLNTTQIFDAGNTTFSSKVKDIDSAITSLFISHFHKDHANLSEIQGAKTLRIPTYVNPSTLILLSNLLGKTVMDGTFSEAHVFEPGETISVGDSQITALSNHHHSADNLIFHIKFPESQVVLANDLGGTYQQNCTLANQLTILASSRPIDLLVVDPLGPGDETLLLKTYDQQICHFLTEHVAFKSLPVLMNVRYGSTSFVDWFRSGGLFDVCRGQLALTSDTYFSESVDVFVNPRLHQLITMMPEIYNLIPYHSYKVFESEDQLDGSKPLQILINDRYNLEIETMNHVLIHTLNPRNLRNSNNRTEFMAKAFDYPDHSFEATEQLLDVLRPKAVAFSHSATKAHRQALVDKGVNIVLPRYKATYSF